MNPRLKKIIFDKLNEDLSKVEIILAENQSIWFIDRANKYWYFELEKSGKLWWRYEFFTEFFILFCLKIDEFQPLLSEWVEGILNYEVNTTTDLCLPRPTAVEGILNYGVNTTVEVGIRIRTGVEGVLNYGVNTTDGALTVSDNMVEGVLNHEVKATMPKNNRSIGVEGIFDSNINMTPRSGHRLHSTVEGILNHGYRKGSRKVDEVLNHEVDTNTEGRHNKPRRVDEVLNHEENSTVIVGALSPLLMEEDINCKVNSTCSALSPPRATVERVLNRKINSTVNLLGEFVPIVEEVLNHRVTETSLSGWGGPGSVEKVLNNGITETIGTTIRDTQQVKEMMSRGDIVHTPVEDILNYKVVSISHANEQNELIQQILVHELIYEVESVTPLDTPASDSVNEVLKNS